MREQLHAQAPAKLILSGEHAVLYGCPALATSIDLPTQVTLTLDSTQPAGLTLDLIDFTRHYSFSWHDVLARGAILQQRYRAFQQGQLTIDQLLTRPSDLVILVLSHGAISPLIQQQACSIQIRSQAWLGRGLGSSAACLLALLAVWRNAQRPNVSDDLTLAVLIEQAQHLENWQHGRSSGLDPSIIALGGAGRFERATGLTALPSWPLSAWLIDTGAPHSSTGECVSDVARRYDTQAAIWPEFKQVTELMQQAWLAQDLNALKLQLNHNHQLLRQLGVVPSALDAPIAQLQQLGGVKLCGAGSIAGDAGGVLLYLGDTPPDAICQTQGWRAQPIQLGSAGLTWTKLAANGAIK
ncbi:GHMP kinase [Thiomicrospira aerophila AL3]|uniref:GHMP kinase n=1 Tax=Thiomicrospira aerophila AL3 TaxID=717772 RepID=W0DTV7_9GAMM|nr:GHMP kinase [Thiomicrospira aerophila]AHF01882.1 GHMP kinase [Thiomicrospira aerophila AL3]